MTRKRMRIEYLIELFGAAATAVLFFVLLFGPTLAANRANGLIRDRIGYLVSRQGINPVELAAIADHPVARVCFGYEYTPVQAVAERNGVQVDLPPETQIPELSYGVLIIGPTGEVTYGALHSTEFIAPTYYRCHTGGRLAIQFDDTYPLSGGRLVDLDTPDLRPAMIEQ